MSATFPSQDDLRIPPKPRSVRLPGLSHRYRLLLQQMAAAAAGFGLAWMLTALLIG